MAWRGSGADPRCSVRSSTAAPAPSPKRMHGGAVFPVRERCSAVRRRRRATVLTCPERIEGVRGRKRVDEARAGRVDVDAPTRACAPSFFCSQQAVEGIKRVGRAGRVKDLVDVFGRLPAISSAWSAAAQPKRGVAARPGSGVTMRRSRIPVRSRIHSSLVSSLGKIVVGEAFFGKARYRCR